jgi:hypothetical protein
VLAHWLVSVGLLAGATGCGASRGVEAATLPVPPLRGALADDFHYAGHTVVLSLRAHEHDASSLQMEVRPLERLSP